MGLNGALDLMWGFPPGAQEAGSVPFGEGGTVYGVSWDGGAVPTLTRTDDAVGMVAAAGVDAGVVVNDFDAADIYSEITEVTDALGNVFVRIPKFYIEKTANGAARTWRISKTGPGSTGYLPACFWDFDAGTELDYIDVGKYPAGLDGSNRLTSKANEYPLINKTIVEMRGYAQANGAGYQQLDIHVVDILQVLFYVEFATLHSQGVMAGYTTGRYTDQDLLTADTNPAGNTLVVSNATGAQYRVGQAISVGTSQGGNQRFYGRTITNIQADTPAAGNTTITFDGDPAALSTGDMLYNSGYKNGDAIAATSGSVNSNTNGKHYCKYRGVVSPWGNIYQLVDGVNINDWQGWVCRDANQYESNLFAPPYEKLSYVNHNANGYAVSMGQDPDRPFAELPVAIDTSIANSAYKDNYSQTAAQRIARWGGYWSIGVYAGLSSWYLDNPSSGAVAHLGGRLVRKASLDNVKVWWRSDQGTYQDAALTTPATDDSDTVQAWRDLRGNEIAAVGETTPASIKVDAWGRRAVHGDDSNTALFTDEGVIGSVSQAHLFLVGCSLISGAVDDQWLGVSREGNFYSTHSYFFFENTAGHHRVSVNNGGPIADLWRGGSTTYPEIVEIKYDGTAGLLSISYNGGKWDTLDTGIPATLDLLYKINVMCYYSTATISREFSGDMYEVVWSGNMLSDAERQSMLDYLAARYNLALHTEDVEAVALDEGDTYYDAFTRFLAFENDVVCIVARRGTDHVDADDGAIVQWRSVDGMETFAAAETIISVEGSDFRDPAGGVVPATNTGIIWTRDREAGGAGDDVCHCLRSVDAGDNWTDVYQYTPGGVVTAFGPLCILPSGKLRQTFYHHNTRVWWLDSSDDGLTWSEAGSTTVCKGEPAMACVGGASDAAAELVLVSRQPGEHPLRMASSSDGGDTWTDNGELFAEPQTQYDVSPCLYVDGELLHLLYAARDHKRIVRYSANKADILNNPAAWGSRKVVYRLDANDDAHCGYPSMARVGGVLRYAWYDAPHGYSLMPNVYISAAE